MKRAPTLTLFFAAMLALAAAVSAEPKQPVATVNLVAPDQVYSAGDVMEVVGSGFLPNETINYALFTAIYSDRTIWDEDVVAPSFDVVVNSRGELSGTVVVGTFPPNTVWADLLLIAESSAVRSTEWFDVDAPMGMARIAKPAAVTPGDVVIHDNNGIAPVGMVVPGERVDFDETLSTGWDTDNPEAHIVAVQQRQYSDQAGNDYINVTANLVLDNVSLLGDAISGYTNLTGSFDGTAQSIKFRVVVMDQDYSGKWSESNALLIAQPQVVSAYATDLTTIVVNLAMPVKAPAVNGDAIDNWAVSWGLQTPAVSAVSPLDSLTSELTLTLASPLSDRGATPIVQFTSNAGEYETAGEVAMISTEAPHITAEDSIPPAPVSFDNLTVNTLIGNTAAYKLKATVEAGTDISLEKVRIRGSNDGENWTEIDSVTYTEPGSSSDEMTWDVTVAANRFAMLSVCAVDDNGNASIEIVGETNSENDLRTAFRLEITSIAETVTVSDGGTAAHSAKVDICTVNRYGLPAARHNLITTTWNLSSTSTGEPKFWSNDGATSRIYAVDVTNNGGNTSSFYYTDTQAGTPIITVGKTDNPPFSGIGDSKNSVEQEQIINAGVASKLLIVLPGENITPGTATGKTGSADAQALGSDLTGAVDIYTVDAFWNPSNVSSDVYINVVSSTPAATTITDLNGGAAGQATITSGTNKVSFAKDEITFTAAGTYTITVSASSYTSNTSAPITVSAGEASKLLVVLPGQNFVNGVGVSGSPSERTAGVSFNIKLYIVDDNNNQVTSENNTRDIDFTSTASDALTGNKPTIKSFTSESDAWDNMSISFSSGSSENIVVVFYRAESGRTITASDNSGSPTLSGVASSGVTVGAGALDNFMVNLTATAERNVNFTGTNTVTARDAYNNTLTAFDASATNVTMTVASGGGAVEIGSRENPILDQQSDFANGVANLTTLGIRYTNGAEGGKTIKAAAGDKEGTSDTVTITINAPEVSSPSPANNTQIATSGGSQTFTATFSETNATGTYTLKWRTGMSLDDSSGDALDEVAAMTSQDKITATIPAGTISAMSGKNYLFWWFDGKDAAGNDLVGSPAPDNRQVMILDPTVTFTGEQLAFAVAPGMTAPFASIDATGEMAGASVTITRLQFSKSGSAVKEDIDKVHLYLDVDKSDDVSGGDILLQSIDVDSDQKLNSLNFNSFSQSVTVTGTSTVRFLLVLEVNKDANMTSKIGYVVHDEAGITLGTAVADIDGSFPVPAVMVDISLPVELASFAGEASLEGVTLNWTTASEVENAGFYVLRATSEDGPFAFQSEFILGQGTTPYGHAYEWTDANVIPGVEYWYALEQRDYDGTVTREESVVHVVAAAPTEWRLRPNVPNPFNPTTTFAFELPQSGEVHLVVYDVTGRMVRTLVSSHMSAGIHHVRWDGTDNTGRNVASGVYVIRFIADEGRVQQVQRASLVR